MAEPKSLLDRIGDALKGDEQKKETAQPAPAPVPAAVAAPVAAHVEEAKQAISQASEAAQQAADAAKQQVAELRSKLADKDHELTQKTWELTKKERELTDNVAALAEKDKEIASLQAALKAAQDELTHLREQAQTVGRSVASAAARTYTVKPGDSLSVIAKAVYGDAGRWPEIFEANKNLIKDPKLIHPGQVLQIP